MIQERTSPISDLALIFLSALLLLALCVSAKFAMQTGLSWHCPVMTLVHLPCPSCGSTRAFAALSELRFLDALRFNPLLVSAIPMATIGFLRRGFLHKYSRLGWPLLVAAVTANWIYLYLFLPR